MDIIEEAITKAIYFNKNIDITDFPTITFIDRDITMIDYDVIMINTVMIYDKTGINIKNLSLRKVGRTKGHIKVRLQHNNNLWINYDNQTDLELLEHYLKQDYERIIITCRGKYIPPIFKDTYTSNLSLILPFLEYNFLNSIPCHNVDIQTHDTLLPSFEMLKCRKFKLTCGHIQSIPLMPNAAEVVLHLDNTDSLVFKGNESIERLKIYTPTEDHVILRNFPSLTKLEAIANLVVPVTILSSLRKLKFCQQNGTPTAASLIQVDNNIVITIDGYLSKIKFAFERLEVLCGTLQSKLHRSMPNLKKLYTAEVLDVEDIPLGLQEFTLSEQEELTDDIVTLCKYLLTMNSIQRMSLYLSEVDHGYQLRNDIYYNICISYDDDVEWYRDIEIDTDLIPQLKEVLLLNRDYVIRESSLLMKLGESEHKWH